ncbi:hypothetical protein ACFUJU_28845 [Streptomyces sp. NPDC057235]|uniref:hypothetical protein n=1 Tax=Streptomyces sp. NPDC057235 TaxID=3346058 RepID=UPI00362A5991
MSDKPLTPIPLVPASAVLPEAPPPSAGTRGTRTARMRARRIRLDQSGYGPGAEEELVEVEVTETVDTEPEPEPEAEPEPLPKDAELPFLQQRRVRWTLYNGTAAAAGHLLVWGITGDPMAGAAYMGRMSISVPELSAAGLTAGCLIAGWKGAKAVRLHRIPGPAGLAARPVAAVAAAMWGQGTAPLVRDAMAAAEPWSTTLAPLLAVGPVAAALWWGLDHRAQAARLIAPVRWLARIPFATTILSALLYAPGAVL